MTKNPKTAYDPRSADVTARVFFQGLMIMCFNKRKELEVGFIRCPGHEPRMRITVQGPGAETTEFKSQITSDLYIRAVNSTSSRVTPTRAPGELSFHRRPDLEGRKFHNDKVTVNTSVLTTRLSVNAGELYTAKTTKLEYNVTTWTDPDLGGTPVGSFGKLARVTGLNIQCHGLGGGIAIFDRVTREKSWLPVLPGTSYKIEIDNDCDHAHLLSAGSDFRLQYTTDLITTSDGKKFDFEPKGAKRSPEVCLGGTTGKTSTFGLPLCTTEELNERAESTDKPRQDREKRNR